MGALKKQQEKVVVEEGKSDKSGEIKIKDTDREEIETPIEEEQIQNSQNESLKVGAKGVRKLLTETKEADEDFEMAMKKRQQRIRDGDVAETKSSEENTNTVIQYDDGLEVAMEKQQSKIETKTERDFTAIKSAATNQCPQMDTDLEEAMRK